MADKENPENLLLEKKSSEKEHIGFAEAYLVIAFAAVADLFEFVAALSILALIGIVLFPIAALYGYITSGFIFLWSILRGSFISRRVSKRIKGLLKDPKKMRIILTTIGISGDAFSGSFLPIRTIFVILTIVLTNYFIKKDMKEIEKLLKKFNFV